MTCDIDWSAWKAVDLATLLFVVKDGRILLIHKKRGLGAGKINGPGGRFEPGETAEQCAIREVQEELCFTPTNVRQLGELLFQFVDGYSIHGYVFRADDCDGVPTETDEARPQWFAIDQIPYERMWADDALWMPMFLREQQFHGKFVFDGDAMLWHEVHAV